MPPFPANSIRLSTSESSAVPIQFKMGEFNLMGEQEVTDSELWTGVHGGSGMRVFLVFVLFLETWFIKTC